LPTFAFKGNIIRSIISRVESSVHTQTLFISSQNICLWSILPPTLLKRPWLSSYVHISNDIKYLFEHTPTLINVDKDVS